MRHIPYLSQYLGAWAIHEESGSSLISMVQDINLHVHLDRVAEHPEDHDEGLPVTINNGTAIIPISGVLTKQISSATGGTSTIEVRRAIRAAAASEAVNSIMLVIDSPGGTVAGTADLAADIAQIAERMPVIAFIEDAAFSGGFWIASQASHVFINESGRTGSIGAFMVIHDVSKQAENEGVKVHVIKSGELKGAAISGVEVTPVVLAEAQRLVDDSAARFISAVASGRKMGREKVQALATGVVFVSEEAVANGLVDRIATFDEVFQFTQQLGVRSMFDPISTGPIQGEDVTLVAAAVPTTGPVQAVQPQPVAATGPVVPVAAPVAAPAAPVVQDPRQIHTSTVLVTPGPSAAEQIAQYQAALPGADPQFVLEQISAGKSIPEAVLEHMRRLSAANAQLTAQVAQPAQVPAAAPLHAAPQLSAVGQPLHYVSVMERHGQQVQQVDQSELVAQFTTRVRQRQVSASGTMLFQEAAIQIAKEFPEGHKAFVAACPGGRDSNDIASLR